MPSLIIVGGPNGSGKTTLTKYLVENGRINSEVINPDEIAANELGGYKHQVQAARIAIARRREAIDNNLDLAFETTFSGNSEIQEALRAKNKGYRLILYFVVLQSALDNIVRVEQRITNAGHNIERDDILRRYEKSRANLESYIGIFDKAYLFDNSLSQFSRVAICENGKVRWSNEKHQHHPFYGELLKS
jgi:predicted ABC-type ATPase